MPNRISRRVECHLDQQLGLWSRLLPWRRELAAHIVDAYQASLTNRNDQEAWQQALAEFGDVRQVASQLQSEHQPQFLFWRMVAGLISIVIMLCVMHPIILLKWTALIVVLYPWFVMILLDAFRGSVCWQKASNVGTKGALAGSLLGTAGVIVSFNNPYLFGYFLSVSILCALYAVLFFTPRRSVVACLIGLMLVNYGITAMAVTDFSNLEFVSGYDLLKYYGSRFDKNFAKIVLAIFCASICAGLARFGISGVAKHGLTIGTGVFLVSLIFQYSTLSGPSALLPNLGIAFAGFAFAVVASNCMSDLTNAWYHYTTS